MSCLSCDNTGYRKLCNYDNLHNTCGLIPINPVPNQRID